MRNFLPAIYNSANVSSLAPKDLGRRRNQSPSITLFKQCILTDVSLDAGGTGGNNTSISIDHQTNSSGTNEKVPGAQTRTIGATTSATAKNNRNNGV